MKNWNALVLLSCLTIACDEDPARKVKIVARPPSAAPIVKNLPELVAMPAEKSIPPKDTGVTKTASSGAPKPSPANPAATSEWRPAGCPPPSEDSPGPSTLKVTGPCAFEHRGTFSCEALHDDFYISASRKATGRASLMVYINVERYKGPGTYQGAEMFIGLQDATSINRWSSDQVSITIGPEEAYAVLPTTNLEAEPLLVDCSGPQTNYQCGGRSDTAPINGTFEVAAGTLQCAPKSK
jgi:hypothetical protein